MPFRPVFDIIKSSVLKGLIALSSEVKQLTKELIKACARIEVLEKENTQLRKEVTRLSVFESKFSALTAQVERLQQTVDQLLKHRFGSRSERFEDSDSPQMSLFGKNGSDDTKSSHELNPDLEDGRPSPEEPANDKGFGEPDQNSSEDNDSSKPNGRKRKKRVFYPDNLPRDIIEFDVAADKRNCHCGKTMPVIGYDDKEVLNYVPETFSITVERYLKRACSCKQCTQKAPAIKRILPCVLMSDALLAQIILPKCLDRQPAYHLSKRWESRHGATIPRDSMSRWSIQLAKQLQPIYNLIQEEIKNYDIASLDATWIQVLKELGKRAQTKSKAWLITGGRPETPVTILEYCASDHKNFLNDKLADFEGTLHGNADPCYQKFHHYNMTMSYCNSHSRRHYKAIADSAKNKDGIATHMLREYKKLYAIEKEIKALNPEQKQKIRQEKAKPILEAMHQYLTDNSDDVPPKSKLRQAMDYTLRYWPGLIQYLNDGRLHSDNNHTQRQIRQFVMARNNFLFADTVADAKTLCLHFSIIQTAIQNGLDPYVYYVHLFKYLPLCKAVEDYERLLPWHVSRSNLKQVLQVS